MQNFVTFSRNVFIPLTRVCRNNCAYCGFKREINDKCVLLDKQSVVRLLRRGAARSCTEALFTFGEQPEEVDGFSDRLKKIGFDSFIDYLLECSKIAIKLGLLPHTNAGVLPDTDLLKMKSVNASMGLMLETVANLKAHNDSPGKNPRERIRFIETSGRYRIPFTTGILVGIGEDENDRINSLKVIAGIHRRYGHIQEVIIQNFSPKPDTRMSDAPIPSTGVMLQTVSLARDILPPDVAVQVAPNLIHPKILIEHGACDLGGISPVTIDYINPEAAWPNARELADAAGVPLRERLPIYPRYIKAGWYSKEIKPLIDRLADKDGFRKVVFV
ncbi:MAG: FO synthase subunit 1 [Candidatus Argoarchaeum ethanivorans]|uniref:7,8-didemethyl-8-hydroxy-5-deazariboflavin synthase n=1 Tax=Candidatus Argoarchaeum ethanivorans TaxID=2608793 RepID=A0A811TCB1_9EURY|nr:MAG: FO synthase subunit 1 [Candidatus Argoarchaeum ethanivorans]